MDLKAATAMFEELRDKVFPNYKLGLLHGRMKAGEKEAVMQSFTEGDIQILVSTTVIEVGVDVPNASLMIIAHAERFGLCPSFINCAGAAGAARNKATACF